MAQPNDLIPLNQSNDELAARERIKFWTPALRNVLYISYACLVMWLFGLPWWADLLNGWFGDMVNEQAPNGICSVPPAQMQCYGGRNFAELAAASGRRGGCGCGQGVLGEALCPVYDYGYQISGLTATAFGTGTTAVVSAVPCAAMWWANAILSEQLPMSDKVKNLLWWLLAWAQLLYFGFVMSPICIFGPIHLIVCVACGAVGLLERTIITYQCALHRQSARVAWIVGALSAFSVVSLFASMIGAFVFLRKMTDWPYGLWLGQSLGLCSALAVAPAVLLFGRVASSSKFNAELSWEDR